MTQKLKAALAWIMALPQDPKRMTLALGLVGWILIALNYPFAWSIPEYAAY